MSVGLRAAVRQVREVALKGVRALGGFESLANSAWRRDRLLILCYHGVSLRDEHEWNGQLFVSPAFLRRRLEMLRDSGCKVLTLDEGVRRLREGTLPPRSVVLTFDDGLYDFAAVAVPLLEEFGFPATNYVSTYYCIHQEPVANVALRYLLWRARDRTLAPGMLAGQSGAVDLRDPNQRERLADNLFNAPNVIAGGAAAQQAVLVESAERLGVDWDAVVRDRLFHLMTAAEVGDVARRGFDIQLHTHRHRTPREEAVFRDEVAVNRRILEEMTGRPAVHFCYPSGDIDVRFLPWLRELEVATATTTADAGLAKAVHDPLLLPRFVDTMTQSEVTFESWLCGVGALLRPGSA